MEKLKALAALVICILLPLQVFACPTAGDEHGRTFFEIFNSDYTLRTMFYSQELNHFYRRESSLATDIISYRDSFSFPIVTEENFENITYMSMTDDDIMSGKPISVFMHGVRYDMTVRLDTTFMALRRFTENSDEQIKNLYYDVLVKRLYWGDENDTRREELLNAQNRIHELGLTLANPSILKIEIGIIPEDMFFTEIDDNTRIALDEIFDPIELRIFGRGAEDLVAVNIESGNIYKIPTYTDGISYTFQIIEAGTYVLAENDFEADYVDYADWLRGVIARFSNGFVLPAPIDTVETEEVSDNPQPDEPTRSINWFFAALAACALIIGIITVFARASFKR
jgi:hypothetical protein